MANTTSSSTPRGGLRALLERRKYEFLLAALMQHLFIAVLLPDLAFYARFVWPLNMVVLGVFSVGIFAERSAAHRAFKNAMTLAVIAIPTALAFLMQALYYGVPGSFRGIDTSSFPSIYLDLVYFCSIVLTSIGFGDITPAHHVTKLAAALLGITGQTYSVVLVGILISKYTSAETK